MAVRGNRRYLETSGLVLVCILAWTAGAAAGAAKSGRAVGDLVINEIHYDPAMGTPGDANGDGIRDGYDDEFVELINVSGAVLDLSGHSVWDGLEERHVFPSGTVIEDGCAVVVFGGGTPDGVFGETTVVHTASSGTLSLNNSGDTVAVIDDAMVLVASYDYSATPAIDQSLTRDPDITGDFSPHTLACTGVLFSPGTSSCGLPFPLGGDNTPPVADAGPDFNMDLGGAVVLTGSATDGDEEPIVAWEWTFHSVPDGSTPGLSDPSAQYPVFTPDLRGEYVLHLRASDGTDWSLADPLDILVLKAERMVINEVLHDPPPEPDGDANQDGVFNSTQDEFIEFVNNTEWDFDLVGYWIEDAVGVRHVFDLAPVVKGCSMVVFGGGSLVNFHDAPAHTASTGSLGLSNSGDTVTLYDANGNIEDRFTYDATVADQSWTRSPDITGDFAPHASVPSGLLFSPGRIVTGQYFPPCDPVLGVEDPVPFAHAVLDQNTPNPFNPSTLIRFVTGRDGQVSLRIYDASGRLMRSLVDEVLGADRHEARWDGRDDGGRRTGSGVYYYRLETGAETITRKMVLLK